MTDGLIIPKLRFIMAITTQFNFYDNLEEMAIAISSNALLLKPSVIKTLIITIKKSLIIRKLGKLKYSDCQNFKQLIQSIPKLVNISNFYSLLIRLGLWIKSF